MFNCYCATYFVVEHYIGTEKCDDKQFWRKKQTGNRFGAVENSECTILIEIYGDIPSRNQSVVPHTGKITDELLEKQR